jgi:hypothetical protein
VHGAISRPAASATSFEQRRNCGLLKPDSPAHISGGVSCRPQSSLRTYSSATSLYQPRTCELVTEDGQVDQATSGGGSCRPQSSLRTCMGEAEDSCGASAPQLHKGHDSLTRPHLRRRVLPPTIQFQHLQQAQQDCVSTATAGWSGETARPTSQAAGPAAHSPASTPAESATS